MIQRIRNLEGQVYDFSSIYVSRVNNNKEMSNSVKKKFNKNGPSKEQKTQNKMTQKKNRNIFIIKQEEEE